MKKISFVLPCYNVEEYLLECLKSIYSQGVSEEVFEVVCVNDCSTDDTRRIIERFQVGHPNFQFINHNTNLTSGGARNTGIENSSGEYIWFVDPDDIIQTQSLASVLGLLDPSVDILLFNNIQMDNDGRILKEERVFPYSKKCDGQAFVESLFQGRLSQVGIVWRCVFRRSFLEENSIRFPLIRKSQDVVFMWNCLLLARCVISVEDCFYVYRVNPYSIANQRLNPRVAFSERILFGYEVKKCLGIDVYIAPAIRRDIEKTISWCANDNMSLLSRMRKKKLKEYYYEMKCNRDAVLSLIPYMNRKSRFLYGERSSCSFWLLKVAIMKLYKKLRS